MSDFTPGVLHASPTQARRHPDDAAHRQQLRQQLRNIREQRGMPQKDLAEILGVTHSAVSAQEIATGDILTPALGQWAHALGHNLTYQTRGIPNPAGHSTEHMAVIAAMHAAAVAAGHHERAHRYAISDLIARMAAARRWYGYSPKQVAGRVCAAPAAVRNIERDEDWPLLGSLQRYVRALGGCLTVVIVPAVPDGGP